MSKAVFHTINPYYKLVTSHSSTIFDPDEYQLNQIISTLTPVAMRVLFYALANLNGDGSIELKPVVLSRLMQTPSSYVSVGIVTLIKYNIIQRKGRTTYWLSPSVAKPISIQIS